MQVTKKDLEKSQSELTIEMTPEEFQPFIEKGAQKISEKVKIEGFRPGKAPLAILKQKVGEMTILEEAAHQAIHKTIDDIIEKNTMDRMAVGQPKVEITKLAPGNPFEYKVTIAIMPTVALGKYKDLKIKVTEAKVEKVDIEKTIKELQEMRVKETLSETEVGDNNKVLVDVEMFIDKVPVEGGQTKDLADLEKTLSENIMADRKSQADNKSELEMLDAIAVNTKFGDLPEAMVESETHHMMHEIEDNLARQGGKMEDYLQHLGKTRNELVLELLPNAVKRVKTALVMKEVGVVEKLDASEKEIDKKLDELKTEHKDDNSLEKMATDKNYRRYLGNVIQNEKVLLKLKEWNYADSGHQQKS